MENDLMGSANDIAAAVQRESLAKRSQYMKSVFRSVRHSALAKPLRQLAHQCRDGLRAVRRHRRELAGAIRAKGIGEIETTIGNSKIKKIAFLRKRAHDFRDLSRLVRGKRKERKALSALSKLSDGEFILVIAELLFQGRGASPVELEQFKQHLREDKNKRSELIDRLLGEHLIRLEHGEQFEHNPHHVQVMGTSDRITREMWDTKAAEIGLTSPSKNKDHTNLVERKFEHSGEYTVSAIASLYKGRRYLENFLETITTQTIFNRSELIIIDANSPDGESELIEKYQNIYPNIVYKKVNHRIGIYDAWNDAVELARGKYLTNTNLDDLRRVDSFELQAGALDEFEFADVVYQDFFYSFNSDLDFEDVSKFGYKSALPIITANNLLRFNSPHNAPMWRARLHEQLGLFDTSFKSAGDYEFWLRCLLNGKRFYKLNSPHVVYYQNPDGISTGPQSRGIVESRRVMNMYARRLASPHLKKSRIEFAADLGIEPTWSWETPLYNVVQEELAQLNRKVA